MAEAPKAAKRTNWKREIGDPYAEGADAAVEGQPGTRNPYPAGSESFLLWDNGWMSVADDETIDEEEWD